jgi:prepilin-type N-terminal cleavage/methylation domain-containing protein
MNAMFRRQRRRGAEAGVTLIELLIAITLVSLLAVGLLFAMRVGLKAMETTNRRVMTNRKTVGAERILQQQIAGFVPIRVQCRGNEAKPTSGLTAFFQGEPQVMRFVSTYSLQEASRGNPLVLEFFVIAGENGEGQRLVVNERPYTGPFGAGAYCLPPAPDPVTGALATRFPPPEAGPGSFVLADRLAFCRFVFEEKPRDEAPQLPDRWVLRWARIGEWPRAIRIEMAPLSADPSRLQPMPLVIPIHITRQPADATEFL